jgi:hypothetical protein
MIFSLDLRRARKGDCFLIHSGSAKAPGLVLIDGGPSSVYKPHLRPRLEEIRARRKAGTKTLLLDVLMISHVDDDHIRGVLDLTGEMLEATSKRQPPLVTAASFWHNSFDDVLGKTPKELLAQFGAASTAGELPPDAWVESDEEDEVVRASLQVLASIEQGARLRDNANALKYPRNPQHGGKLILADGESLSVAEGLTFRVAGPMQPELLALQKKHQEWLKDHQDEGAESSLAAYIDKSVPNLSSVVVLAESGGKKMLLTGDARGDKVLEGLEQSGLMKKGGTLIVDILKVPHHGSSNNLDVDFFERIKARHYVFSGDGEHGNPERETMEMLLSARGDKPLDIHLTYPIEEIDTNREIDWKKEQKKEVERRKKGSKKPVREDWDPASHSLAAFFAKSKLGPKQKIRVADPVKPHVIDLLDPLGY